MKFRNPFGRKPLTILGGYDNIAERKAEPEEVGRAPFVTHTINTGQEITVTLIFFDDGSVRWEEPVRDGFPPMPTNQLFP